MLFAIIITDIFTSVKMCLLCSFTYSRIQTPPYSWLFFKICYHNIIYKYAQKELPNYGRIELGDIRVRNANDLKKLVLKIFSNSQVTITPHILYLTDDPKPLACEVARFFYASIVLSDQVHAKMLKELEKYFSSRLYKGLGSFIMPINLLYIKKN